MIPMDPFELLGLRRRPLLSEEEIGASYRKLAGEFHPDQAGGDVNRFKELGEAAAILRDPARRLRSLAGVDAGSIPPPEAADLFPKVALFLQEADNLTCRYSAATNPLTKAVLAAPLRKLTSDLESLLGMLHEWHASLDTRLSTLDALWPAYDPMAVTSLADSFSYVARWESQLRERMLSLNCL